jgi:hypothetical protein
MKRLAYVGLAVFLMILVLGALAFAIPRPPKESNIMPPERINPVEALLRAASIDQPWQHEGLTIFPVRLDPVRSFGKPLTLDEAVDEGVLKISELGSGEVNRVMVNNRSDHHIFLMAGEAITGAKQDRMVKDDLLLPPHTRREIGVYCVEHGRWTEGTEFKSGKFMAPSNVRNRAMASKSQSEVWASVAESQRANGAPQGSLRTVPSSPKLQERIMPYKKHFGDLPKMADRTCGVIVAYGREWLAVDIFQDATLFRKLWPKLLDSYLMEVGSRSNRLKDRPNVHDAEQFLGQLYWAKQDPASTDGAGRRVELRGRGIYGSALIVEQSVLHLEAFPGAQIVPMDEQGQHRTPSLEYRRQRLEGNR